MIHPVRLDAEHLYWVPAQNGEAQVPGYTAITHDLGIVKDNQFYTEEGRAEGVALHKWVRYIASGRIPTTKPDYRIAGRVEGIIKFVTDTGFKFEGGEEPRYDPINRFACTPDIWGFMGSWSWNLDAKSGVELEGHPLQTAAQSIALKANGFRAQKRGCLYLKDGDYRLIEHTNSRDIPAWTQFVSAYYLKSSYR